MGRDQNVNINRSLEKVDPNPHGWHYEIQQFSRGSNCRYDGNSKRAEILYLIKVCADMIHITFICTGNQNICVTCYFDIHLIEVFWNQTKSISQVCQYLLTLLYPAPSTVSEYQTSYIYSSS